MAILGGPEAKAQFISGLRSLADRMESAEMIEVVVSLDREVVEVAPEGEWRKYTLTGRETLTATYRRVTKEGR